VEFAAARDTDTDSDEDLANREPGEEATARVRELRRQARRSLRAFWLDVHTEERMWRATARGKKVVAARLAKLGPQWHVLHSVPVTGGAEVDHLVVGPSGVFLLSTKNHERERVRVRKSGVKVNGRPTTYLRQAREEARGASERLSAACGVVVRVEPVIVVMAQHLKVKRQPQGVTVVGRRSIVRWLRSREPSDVLTDDEVSAIYGRARLRSTWQ
jgi:hypothetical protein